MRAAPSLQEESLPFAAEMYHHPLAGPRVKGVIERNYLWPLLAFFAPGRGIRLDFASRRAELQSEVCPVVHAAVGAPGGLAASVLDA